MRSESAAVAKRPIELSAALDFIHGLDILTAFPFELPQNKLFELINVKSANAPLQTL